MSQKKDWAAEFQREHKPGESCWIRDPVTGWSRVHLGLSVIGDAAHGARTELVEMAGYYPVGDLRFCRLKPMGENGEARPAGRARRGEIKGQVDLCEEARKKQQAAETAEGWKGC